MGFSFSKDRKKKVKPLGPEISMELLNRAKAFKPQKSLGQNFLINEWALDDAIEHANLDPEKDIVIEIGPGLGFLTEKLIPNCKHLYAVDIDSGTQKSMTILEANHKNFTFLRQDFLRTKLEDLKNDYLEKYPEHEGEIKFKIIANIPYQISSMIILHLIGEIDGESENKKYLDEILILVQREFGKRLCAEPGTKAYGAMTLLLKYWAKVEYLFDVSKESFYPQPKVESAYIKIVPLSEPSVKTEKPKKLRTFIRAIFGNRRKKLSNGLIRAGYDKEKVESLELGNTRGETLSLPEIVDIVEKL